MEIETQQEPQTQAMEPKRPSLLGRLLDIVDLTAENPVTHKALKDLFTDAWYDPRFDHQIKPQKS